MMGVVKAGELGKCCNRNLCSNPEPQISSSQAVLLDRYIEKAPVRKGSGCCQREGDWMRFLFILKNNLDKLQLPWTMLPSRYAGKLGMGGLSDASLMILLKLYQKQNKNALDAEINYPDVQMLVSV